MSTLDDVWRDKAITPAAKLVACRIHTHAAGGWCEESVAKLADECGLNDQTVAVAIASLMERGLLEIETRAGYTTRRRLRGATKAAQVAKPAPKRDEAARPDTSPRRAFMYDDEIAALFRVAASTPRYWRFIEKLPTVRVGRRAAVPRSAVAELAASMGISDRDIDAAIDGHRTIDG